MTNLTTKEFNLLPFLKNKLEASVSAPVESLERKPDEGAEEFDTAEAVAQDILDAVKSNDAKMLAQALRAAFDLLEMQPHDEIKHD